MRTIQVPADILVKIPVPANYLQASSEGGLSIDVGHLSDDDLQRVADEVRAEFVENALRRRREAAR